MPEKYRDLTGRLQMTCIKLCETKPGANTSLATGDRQHGMNKTGTHTTVVHLTPPSVPGRGSKKPSTRAKTTLWDGDLNFALNDLESHPDTAKPEDAAGMGFATADPAKSAVDDERPAGIKTPSGAPRRMQYPKTTLPTFDDPDLIAEASPFFVYTKSTNTGMQSVESEPEVSLSDSSSAADGEPSGGMSVFDEDKQRDMDFDIGLGDDMREPTEGAADDGAGDDGDADDGDNQYE